MRSPGLRLALLPLCLLLAACGSAAARSDVRGRERSHAARTTEVGPDTSVYVLRPGSRQLNTASTVMQLRVAARDAVVSLDNVAGQRTLAGTGGEATLGIPGSRAVATANPPAGSALVPGWDVAVTTPVLAGERYLVEITPQGAAAESASVTLASDLRQLVTTTFAVGDSAEGPALFEIMISTQGVSVSPAIEAVDVVPTCGTSHVIHSAGLADLFARYEVPETGERGDVHLAPRDADARYRSVVLKTATRGGLRVTYLGRELAAAARPDACANP